jgi:hypothetical protein
MIKSNGGVFGRNPTFQDVTVAGSMTMNGGIVATGTSDAPTSNTVIGSGAGSNLTSGATNNVLIGQGAGDVLGASPNNIAIGRDALGAQTAAAAGIANTIPGTGGSAGTYTGILLEKDSGSGTMTVYPTVTLTVNAGGAVSAIAITSPGSGATVQSGLVLKAVTTPAGVPSDWRGTLSSVTGGNTAIGHNAGLLQTTAVNNTLVGSTAGDAITTGGSNTAVGSQALSANTTASSNTAVGWASMLATTSGSSNTAVGGGALQSNTTGASNVSVGAISLLSAIGSNLVAVGASAGRYRGSGTDTLTDASSSVFIGYQSRAAANSQTNQVVIAGTDGLGNGSNTTTIGNASTTGTFLSGTATSVLSVAGDTVRIVNDKTPANAGAAGTEGDICWDANYIYVCVAANTWKRVAIATWP